MRFKFFGFKGNINTVDGNKKDKKKTSKDDDDSSVVCTYYRTYNTEFDRPPISRPQQGAISNQASTSYVKTNGELSKSIKSEGTNATASPSYAKTNGDVSNITKSEGTNLTVPKPTPRQNPQATKSQITNDIGQHNSLKKPVPPPSAPAPTTPPSLRSSKPRETSDGRKQDHPVNHAITSAVSEDTHETRTLSSDRNKKESDDVQNAEHEVLAVVSGRTAAPSNEDDDGKKSTLIFMTEDHGNHKINYYESDSDDYYYEDEINLNKIEVGNGPGTGTKESYESEYSTQAASIFFSGSDPEPPQRMRKFKYRNDDDNGSQTSA